MDKNSYIYEGLSTLMSTLYFESVQLLCYINSNF